MLEEGSFHRAARTLGYSQPAISQQVAALERAVGCRLVERGVGDPLRPTAAGSILLHHAEAIGHHLAAARADIAGLASGALSTLHVGVYQSAGARLFPQILREFAQSWPDVEVDLTEAVGDAELLALVERGELDLAFVVLPVGLPSLRSVELLRDPYALVVRRDSPLAARERVCSLDEVAKLPLIMFRDCRSAEQTIDALTASGTEPQVVFRSNDNGIVQGMVVAGLGTGLVPSLAVLPHPALTTIELGKLLPRRITGITWHRDRSLTPVADTFLEIARRVCA